MNRNDLEQFAHKLVQTWQTFDEAALNDLYAENITAYMNDQTASFTDIQNRMQFCKNTYETLAFEIQDLILDVTGKIVLKAKQTAKRKDGETEFYDIISIYHLTDGKVTEMWASLFPQLDYFAS